MATYDLTSTTPTKIQTGDILNCPYSGSAKQITLPKGQYKLECWGAQGGYRSSSSYGGNGGYSVGILNLTQETTVYLYVGGAGNTGGTAGGFNGGGSRSSYNGGGGGTDIRIGSNSLYARVIVAGGGGSDGASNNNGMYGGGTSGGTTTKSYGSGGGGGTQTAGGAGGSNNSGTFGQGGQGLSRSNGYGGAGGGGWYGGGGSYPDYSGDDDRGGGGGSGYVYTSSTASNYPSGCLLNSSYYLTNAQTVAGNIAFTSPTGTSETGHTGNGYTRITVIKAGSGNTLVKTTSNTWKKQKQIFINTGASTIVPSGLVELEYIEATGTQYLDTGITVNKNDNKELIMSCQLGNDGNYAGANGYMQYQASITGGAKGILKISYKNKIEKIYFNDVLKLTQDWTSAYSGTNVKLGIFKLGETNNTWYNSSAQQIGKLYYYKLYDNGTLIRDFIPAKRISDGKCGLWDKVNLKFYTDENGGNFTAGTEKTTIAAVGTPIEYLEATGIQYIDTKFKPNSNTRVTCKVSSNQGNQSSYPYIFGAGIAYANTAFEVSTWTAAFNNNSTTTSFNIADNQIHVIDFDKNVVKIDGSTKWTSSGVFSSNFNLYLFGWNLNGSFNASLIGRIYECSMYDNGKLIRDFIPIKTTTNIYGLWDKVNKVFYENAGTGTFTAGPAVNLTGWHKIKGVWAKTAVNTWSQAL